MTKYVFSLFAAVIMVTAVGCSDPGGTAGDANDPAETEDTAQMQDESDEEAAP